MWIDTRHNADKNLWTFQYSWVCNLFNASLNEETQQYNRTNKFDIHRQNNDLVNGIDSRNKKLQIL